MNLDDETLDYRPWELLLARLKEAKRVEAVFDKESIVVHSGLDVINLRHLSVSLMHTNNYDQAIIAVQLDVHRLSGARTDHSVACVLLLLLASRREDSEQELLDEMHELFPDSSVWMAVESFIKDRQTIIRPNGISETLPWSILKEKMARELQAFYFVHRRLVDGALTTASHEFFTSKFDEVVKKLFRDGDVDDDTTSVSLTF